MLKPRNLSNRNLKSGLLFYLSDICVGEMFCFKFLGSKRKVKIVEISKEITSAKRVLTTMKKINLWKFLLDSRPVDSSVPILVNTFKKNLLTLLDWKLCFINHYKIHGDKLSLVPACV